MTRREARRGGGPARRGRGRGWWRPWWRSRRLRAEMLLVRLPLALIAVGLLAHVALREPPSKPRRTDAVTAALGGEVVRAGTGEVLSLHPSPRLSLPSAGLGERKLSFAEELARLPPPPPAPPPAPAPGAAPAPAPAAQAPAAQAPAAPAPTVRAPPAPAAPATAPAASAPTLGDELVLVQPPAPPARPPLGPPAAGRATLAIIIDDVGLSQAAAREAIGLPPPLTLSFLPYAPAIGPLAAAAAARGHEIFLHLPMEPVGGEDPGPNAILTGLPPQELGRRLAWAFERVPKAVGLNNHMGSRATGDPAVMLRVLQEAGRRGLVFIDSKTTPRSVGDRMAAELGLRHAARDVFIDNDLEPAAIRAQLDHAAALARRPQGAIAIGHPHPSTLQVLRAWLPEARRQGIELVTATGLVARQGCGSGTVQVSGGQGGC